MAKACAKLETFHVMTTITLKWQTTLLRDTWTSSRNSNQLGRAAAGR